MIPWRAYLLLGAIGFWLASSGYAYYAGYSYKAKLCNTDILESRIKTLETERNIWKRAAEDAAARESILKSEAEADDKKLDEYEKTLDGASNCRATQHDIDQLR